MYDRTDDILLHYEWDPSKETRNRARHGVAFLDAVAVLESGQSITGQHDERGEVRQVTLGLDPIGRVLVVIWTRRGHRARIISARKATATERSTLRWRR
jgi:hypothetical protein